MSDSARPQGKDTGRGGRSRRGRRRRQTATDWWSMLEEPYRAWLLGRGLATRTSFNSLSLQERINLQGAYDSHDTTFQEQHHLVAIPPNVPPGAAQYLPQLLQMSRRSMNGWNRIRGHRSESDTTAVRSPTLAYYSLTKKHCQILGPGTPHVVNAHIWPHQNMENLDLVGLTTEDIDQPRNILRLHKDIEENFDLMNLTFLFSGGTDGTFDLKVLAPDLLRQELADVGLTFRALNGRSLQFPNGNFPWRRLLGTHCHFAFALGRERGWLPEEQLTAAEIHADEMLGFSLDETAVSRVKLWMNSTANTSST